MNNLKFRAWDKKLQIIGTVSNIDFEYEEVTFYIDDEEELETCQPFEDVELMQSTGLFDKNGVEIFEGDIVRNTHTGSVGRVHWCVHNTGFFYYVEKDKKDYTVFRAKYNLEVIGNVYENKELIQNEI
jgi:hypothetical protein|nr:MAG TPA: YopX protein [Caudoviricetes sp.]